MVSKEHECCNCGKAATHRYWDKFVWAYFCPECADETDEPIPEEAMTNREADKLSLGDRVFFRGKPYDYGGRANNGRVMLFEPGECSMQDMLMVAVEDVERKKGAPE